MSRAIAAPLSPTRPGPHARGDALGERRPRRLQHVGLADQVARERIVEAAGGLRELDHRIGRVLLAPVPTQGAGHEGGTAAHGVLLVEHPAGADGPALVDVADAVGVGHAQVGDELLAELA